MGFFSIKLKQGLGNMCKCVFMVVYSHSFNQMNTISTDSNLFYSGKRREYYDLFHF